MKKKLIGISLFAGLLVLTLALLFLPEYGQEMFIHGTYISQDESYIKLYVSGKTYQFIDIRELTDLPEMRPGDNVTVTYRKGGAFELHRITQVNQQQAKAIVATDLNVDTKWGAIYIKPTNITPTGLQLQMGVFDDRLTDLAISTSFQLYRKTRNGWDHISGWDTENRLTANPEWISFHDGDYTEFNWENIYGVLKPGTYLIHVKIHCNNQSYPYSATFTID